MNVAARCVHCAAADIMNRSCNRGFGAPRFLGSVVVALLGWCANGFGVAQEVSAPAGLTADEALKEVQVVAGAREAQFQFELFNHASEAITVSQIITSCGCTTGKLPENPWTLEPGERGVFDVTMSLIGRTGTVTKSVFVRHSQGILKLQVRSQIPEGVASARAQMTERRRNQLLALRDRTAIFRGQCATCHSKPLEDKHGVELYHLACGICHDSENRASMVPDLRRLKKPTDQAYWETWIRKGRVGSLMAGFDRKHGGPLEEAQLVSLIALLSETGVPPLEQADEPTGRRAVEERPILQEAGDVSAGASLIEGIDPFSFPNQR